jgi:hypothetical protein
MKRPGRPPLDPEDDADTVRLSVRVTPKQFDETQRQAGAARMTMADWIRHMLARGVSSDKTRQ